MKNIFKILLITLFVACAEHSEKKHDVNSNMNKESFDELVKKFDNPSRDHWQKPTLVIEKLGDVKGKNIADIGAGTGYFSFKMAAKGAQVTAIDVDDRFLKHIENNKTSANSTLVKTQKVDFGSPNLIATNFDAVVIINTYHHLENRYDYLREIWRGVKPGGQLLIVDFKTEETPHGPPLKMRIDGFKVMKELQKAGFSKVIIDVTSLPYQYIITARKLEKLLENN